ncbi:hypothetical protein [Streptomyces djakartensis]|uniref:hypothetical protein n=1 Tax=Streptomyces djakartensis TaxID=68193 RepID=UPI0034DE5C19
MSNGNRVKSLSGKLAVILTVAGLSFMVSAPAHAAGGLRFEEMKCEFTEGGDGGPASPYFVLFTGRPDGTTTTTMIRKPWWDNNCEDGYVSKPQQLISANIPNNTFYMAALIEEDVDPDLYQAQINGINSILKQKWQSARTKTQLQQYNTMAPALADAVQDRLGNDDFHDVDGGWVNTQSGWLYPLHFEDGDPDESTTLVRVWLRMV